MVEAKDNSQWGPTAGPADEEYLANMAREHAEGLAGKRKPLEVPSKPPSPGEMPDSDKQAEPADAPPAKPQSEFDVDELLAEATDASPAESQSEFDVDDLLAEPADAPPAEPQPELDVDDSLVEPATPAQQAEPDMDELVSALTGGTQPAAAAGEVDTDTGRPRIRLAKADTRPELSPGLRLLIQVALVVALTGVAAVVAWMLRQ